MTQSPPVPLSTLLPRGANQAIRNASAKTFEFYSVLRQKPDVLASRGWLGCWLVMPKATPSVSDDRKRFSIFTALEIERLVMGTVDVDNLTWF
jgi:hypothetical protein